METLIEMYKIISGKYDTAAANFIKLRSDHVSRDCGRGNSKTLFVQRPRLDVRKHNFSVRSTNIWNSLPDDVVCAKSFKNKLDKILEESGSALQLYGRYSHWKSR